jgi:hypothetical protein
MPQRQPPRRRPADAAGKMKVCNKDAAGKKGDERKAFMSA